MGDLVQSQWLILEIWNSRDDMKTWGKDLENGNQVGITV